MSNVINYDNSYRYIFEPFHPGYVSEVSNFKSKQYLRPDSHGHEYLKPARKILSGKINNRWINKFNRKIVVQRRLIKDIRINLLLGWIKVNFPEIPIVLLLRHPLAVVSSQVSNGWKADLRGFLNQPDLMQDHLEPYKDLMASTKDNFEGLILEWCVETRVPIVQLKSSGIKIVFYENLYLNPETEVPKLFSFIGRPFDPSFMDTIGQPSKTSRINSPVRKGSSPVDNWQRSVIDSQKEFCLKALKCFRLDYIYGIEPLPKLNLSNRQVTESVR